MNGWNIGKAKVEIIVEMLCFRLIIIPLSLQKTNPMTLQTRFFLLITSFFLLLPAIAFPQEPVKVEIGQFIDEWHSDASKADKQAYFDKIDETGVFVGTDATEHWTKQAFYDWSKPHFDKGKAWSFKAEERNIFLSDDQNMAWFDEKLSSASGPLRGSGVIMNRNGEWKIMHYVLSVPVPNEKFSEIMKLIKEK